MNDDGALKAFQTGIWAGALATILMSTLMVASKRYGRMREYPPRKITKVFVEKATGKRPRRKLLNALTTANHLAYGMAAGGGFAAARERLHLKRYPVVSGMLFGLLVWAASYKGWVPAARIMPPPERDQPGRVKTMIAAHLVYGGALGGFLSRN